MTSRLLGIAGALLLAVAPAQGQQRRPPLPADPFPVPTGSFAVGTQDYSWTDSSRPEAYTKDPSDHRRILVQVWYPAEPTPAAVPAPYLLHPATVADTEAVNAASSVRTRAVVDAPLARRDGRLPVLLYNHGGGWARWSATFTTVAMASHGYVVVSIEHPGFSKTGAFLDGTAFAADTTGFPQPTGDLMTDATASFAYLEDPVFPIWVADARFVLDRLADLDRSPGRFRGRLDLSRVGAFGWSFGGATAVELTAVDPRVTVAVDQDGQLFGRVKHEGTRRPILMMHHGVDDAADLPEAQRPVMRRLIAMVEAGDSTAAARSTGPWYDLTIARTQHGHFSDLMLFFPKPAEQLDPAAAHEIINAYTLAFFDRYLRDRASPLLAARQGSPFPEATLTDRRR